MSLATERIEALPPLAWLVELDGAGGARAIVGPGVECRDGALFEGAWAGDFDAFGFAETPYVFGSGVQREDGGLLLVPPAHTLEAIYCLHRKGGALASNSLAFLGAAAGRPLRGSDFAAAARFASIVEGLPRTPIVMNGGAGRLSILHHHNALLTADALVPRPKQLPPEPRGYADYRALLVEVAGAVCANGAAPGRLRRYQPLATVSSGYDSPATATIAREIGARRAITFARARSGEEDSGAPIAAALGLEIVERPRPERAEFEPLQLAQFLASGMQAEDCLYAAFADLLPGSVLFTGFQGGKVWNRSAAPDPHLKRLDISGSSLGEFRLWQDFVHLPLPFVGAQRLAAIARISTAPEMRAWSIGGRYDKPVARRIAEEAGVPRAAFGHSKRAVSLLVFERPALLPPALQRGIAGHAEAREGAARYVVHAARYWLGHAQWFAFKALNRATLRRFEARLHRWRAASLRRLFGWEHIELQHAHPRQARWLAWALDQVGARYREAMARSAPASGSSSGSAPRRA